MKTRPARVLVVENSASLAQTYAGLLEGAGHSVDIAVDGAAASNAIRRARLPYDAIVLDLQLSDCDGLEWLAAAKGLAQHCSIVIATADGSINRAISAMRLGAHDFLVKPIAPERLVTTVRNALESTPLTADSEVVAKIDDGDRFHGFIGKSDAMQSVYRAIENVADSKATVFITGESGTGKEVTAEAIHHAGKRARHNFVAINCGAIPENLLESELFGHVKGAFTGAIENRVGAAREADGGTLFLDEICEMELKLQVKLLRFLQTGMIQRVGSSKPEAVDVRVICATNRDPAAEVAAGRLREDLFYRLSVIPIELPPLRARGDDVRRIAQVLLERIAEEEGKAFEPLADPELAMLATQPWPGNVRELQNAIRRAVVMTSGPTLVSGDFAVAIPTPMAPILACEIASKLENDNLSGLTLAQVERQAIERAIETTGGSLPKAARLLGVSPSTLYRLKARWMSAETVPDRRRAA